MKRKSKAIFITTFVIVFCFIFTTFVNAANFATAIGSTANNINTTNHVNDAADAYDSCGYSGSRRLIDPSYTLLLSNLAAEVQFFSSHGNVDNITFARSGIRVGNEATYGNLEYIGTNNVNLWENNTILVTYAGCYTAGNLAFDSNSITYVTALEGAEITYGFKNEIFPDSLENWARRYNNKLADGYGVQEAAEYANSFIYVHDTVKEGHIVHHGNTNVKIGNYHNTKSSLLNNITNNTERINTLSISNKNLDSSNENIVAVLKDSNKKFNVEDYEISRRTMGSTNVNTGETDEIEYIDVKLKVGDFVTNAGYTIKAVDGKIEKVFDNNINIEVQDSALKNKNEFKVANFAKAEDISELKNKAIDEVKNTYLNTDTIVEDEVSDVTYYFDIETGKKYVMISVRSENHKDGSVGYAYDTVKYEL